MASAEHHTLGGLTQATYRSPLEGWVLSDLTGASLRGSQLLQCLVQRPMEASVRQVLCFPSGSPVPGLWTARCGSPWGECA